MNIRNAALVSQEGIELSLIAALAISLGLPYVALSSKDTIVSCEEHGTRMQSVCPDLDPFEICHALVLEMTF